MGKYEGTEESVTIFIRSTKTTEKKLKKYKNEIKLRSEATSLLDVQRWTFDPRTSACSPMASWTFIFLNIFVWY